MKKYRGYLIAALVLFVLSVFFIFALAGYGFLGLCFFGAAVLTLLYMGLKALGVKHEKPARTLKRILTCAVLLGALAAAVTEGVVVSEAVSAGKSGGDYAIVLGAGVDGTRPSLSLRARLEAALRFAEANPDAILILSGGQGGGEDISEARCMYDWLVDKGIDPARLILEDKSTDTRENLTYSLEKLRALDPDFGTVTIITAGYHIARARMMAEDLGYPQTAAYAAHTSLPVLELNYYLREIPAIWWYLISG